MKSASLQTIVKLSFTASVVGLGVVFAATPAQALSIVTSRTALSGNDFIDWGRVAADETGVDGPFNIDSSGGLSATVSAATNPFLTLTQDRSYFGGFTRGDRLLSTRSSFGGQGPISISFANPISAGGLQIESLSSGDRYTAQIDAFDTAGNLIGNFSQSGQANFGGNAVFLGVTSDVGISRLVYSLPSSSNGRQNIFAINRFDFTRFTAPPTAEVPVPPHALATGLTMALAGLKKLYQKRVAN